jgi:hypothetical protein
MLSRFAAAVVAICAMLGPSSISAATIQTFGSGSAVTSIDATANFESNASLFSNPYTENGLVFTRVGLTLNNNGCGFAGCGGAATFPGTSGNYFYGSTTSSGGYIEIDTALTFTALEFVFGWSVPHAVVWETLLDGNVVGSGSLTGIAGGTIFGFANTTGFDELRIASSATGSVSFNSGDSSPSIDTVRAQFAVGAVPEPSTWAMMILGFSGVGYMTYRRRKVAALAA